MIFFKVEKREELKNKKVDILLIYILKEEVYQILKDLDLDLVQEELQEEVHEALLEEVQEEVLVCKLESILLKPG